MWVLVCCAPWRRDHCYETRTPNRLRRWLLAILPFFGPTIILKVRKVAPAPEKVV
jgi:hypothetical protein